MNDKTEIPTLVLGAGGYVGAEFVRLVDAHPRLELLAAASDSNAGQAIDSVFPHLRGGRATSLAFVSTDRALALVGKAARLAVFSAAPHGAAAQLIRRVLLERGPSDLHIVDASADFRLNDADAFADIYGQAHGAPGCLDKFSSGVPEHVSAIPTPHVGHPGCFATAMQLAIVPLQQRAHGPRQFFANGVTGSTGAGKQPLPSTHTPERHSNLFAYKPLAHRHAPEVRAHVRAATGHTPILSFVPHSGPFARGIHMSVQTPNDAGEDADTLRDAFARYYADAPFVHVVDGMPRLKHVVASNFAHIGIAADADAIHVSVVIDNLLKGAAGGALQWMNRLWGCDERDGLMQLAPGWT